MSEKVVKGYKREMLGSSESRRIRREGKIPAVIYGKNDPMHIAVDAKEFSTAVKTLSESSLLTVKVGRKNHAVLIKDFQEAIIGDELMHLDFFEVVKGETLRTHVPVALEGSSKGVKEGGLLQHVLHELEIECLPKNLPESITVSINELGLNESIHVEALSIPAGVKVLTDADRTVVTVVSKKEETASAEESEEEAEE